MRACACLRVPMCVRVRLRVSLRVRACVRLWTQACACKSCNVIFACFNINFTLACDRFALFYFSGVHVSFLCRDCASTGLSSRLTFACDLLSFVLSPKLKVIVGPAPQYLGIRGVAYRFRQSMASMGKSWAMVGRHGWSMSCHRLNGRSRCS